VTQTAIGIENVMSFAIFVLCSMNTVTPH